jgi:hypothetical protein
MTKPKKPRSKLLDGLIALFCVALIAVVVFPIFAQAKTGGRSPCLSNVKQLATGQLMYVAEWDDRLPQAMVWMDAIQPFVRNERAFYCPEARKNDPQAYGYAMNFPLSQADAGAVPNPKDTVLLFESALLARNATSGFYGLPVPPRHRTVSFAAFLDGHSAALVAERAREYGPDGRKRK